MTFVSALRDHLIGYEKVDDLSRDERFTDFNFIGLKQTITNLDIFAFVKADGLTEEHISELCDKFFNIVRIISYEDFTVSPGSRTVRPGPRNPNGLLCFVFENDYCPVSLLDFAKSQTRISHWEKAAVTVPWLIDVKNKKIYTHRNPVSFLPPVFIDENRTFPKLSYLKTFLRNYRFQLDNSNDVESILRSFRNLEKRVEETHKLLKSISRSQYEDLFSNANIATVIQTSEIYLKNIGDGKIIMNNSGDTYNIGQAAAVGRNARSDNNTFFQSKQKQTLAEAAIEIQKLLKQLEQANPSATEIEKIAYVDDETTPSFKRRVAGAFRASSETAIDEFILENKYLKVIKAAIKGWLQLDG